MIYGLVYWFQYHWWNPILCFIVALLEMSKVHWETQILNSGDGSEHSAIMMVLLIKLSSFGYCVYDGTRNDTV
jgi:hypothetical protein